MTVAVAVLLALLQGVARVPSYDLAKPRARKPIELKTIQPVSPVYGEPVTITGTGFNMVRAVIVGDYAPEILRQDETTIVFRSPRPPRRAQYEARVFLVAPGQPIAAWPSQVVFSQKPRVAAPRAKEVGILFDEEVPLKPGETKRYQLDGTGSAGFTLEIDVRGGEIEVSVESVEPKSEPRVRATYGGTLQWEVGARELGGQRGTMPPKVSMTLISDAARDIVAKVKIVRLGVPLATPSETPPTTPGAPRR